MAGIPVCPVADPAAGARRRLAACRWVVEGGSEFTRPRWLDALAPRVGGRRRS